MAILEYFRRPGSIPKLTLSLPESGVELRALLFQIEKHFYGQALRLVEGNKEKAATLLGLNAPAFRKALRERFPRPGRRAARGLRPWHWPPSR